MDHGSEQRCLRPTEVAERLKIARGRVYQMCRTGQLPSLTIDRSVRIPEAALNQWIEDRMRASWRSQDLDQR